jgi:glycosyltransferase involved in cell wall biosynthesis
MKTRICIVQPLINLYRVSVFEALAARDELDLEIWADLSGSIGSLSGITSSNKLNLKHAEYREYGGLVWQPKILDSIQAGFDVVLLPWNVRSPHLQLALLKKKRSPIVLWGHGFGTHQARLGDWLRIRNASRAEACLFYGPTGRNKFLSLGFDSEKLYIAPNALDQKLIQKSRNRFLNSAGMSETLRAAGVDKCPMMLYLSRLEPEKMPELAIEALQVLLKEIPNLKLIFIGDGSCRAALESKVIQLGLQQSVRFMGSIHEEDRIAPWAVSASLLIHPGALGLSIFHAFGYGLPVITSNLMSIQMPEVESLEPGINGLVYEHGDVMKLAAVCRSVLTDHALRKQLSNGALETVLSPGGRNLDGMVNGMLKAICAVSGRNF